MAFKKYKLSESQLTQIARLCVQEQGCIAGVKAEASLMANQLETSPHRQKQYGTDGSGNKLFICHNKLLSGILSAVRKQFLYLQLSCFF